MDRKGTGPVRSTGNGTLKKGYATDGAKVPKTPKSNTGSGSGSGSGSSSGSKGK